jgi:hypothetical protein
METASGEPQRLPCAGCGALNPPAASFCWQCQESVGVPSGFGSPMRPVSVQPDVHPGSSGGRLSRLLIVSVGAFILAVAGAFVVTRHKSVSLPEQLEGEPRALFQQGEVPSPFGQHPTVRTLEAGYGTDPSAPGSFGISVWITSKGQNGSEPAEILTLGLPSGVKVDVFKGLSASMDGADFECATSTTNMSTMCAWSGGDVAGMVGLRELDLQKALAETERIKTAIGA